MRREHCFKSKTLGTDSLHVWRTTGDDNMSLHENRKDRPPVERSQAAATVSTDRKQTYRLYPSLPDIDTYEVYAPDRRAAVRRPDSLPGDSQSEAAGADIRMKAQILILEEQQQELLSINEKWAKEYRTMKQYYKEKILELKALVQLDHSHFEEEKCEEGEKNVTLHKKVKDKETTWTEELSAELLKAEKEAKEAKELRAQNSTLIRKGQHQHEEIRRLNKALEEALQTAQPLEASGETLLDVWKHQAEVYKEDFLKERRDREKLKGKYLDLEQKFRKVHSELRVLKPQVPRTRPPQPALECTCTHRAKSPDKEVRPTNQRHVQLQKR